MPKLKGLILIIPSTFIALVELYYLIINPLQTDQSPTLSRSQYWALAIPVFFITFMIALLGVWIGYTMIVTTEPMRMTYHSAYEEAAGELADKPVK